MNRSTPILRAMNKKTIHFCIPSDVIHIRTSYVGESTDAQFLGLAPRRLATEANDLLLVTNVILTLVLFRRFFISLA